MTTFAEWSSENFRRSIGLYVTYVMCMYWVSMSNTSISMYG